MKFSNQIDKKSLLIAVASTLLISVTLISCGGGGSSDTIAGANVPVVDGGANVPVVDGGANVPVVDGGTDAPVVDATCVPDVSPAPGLLVVSPAGNVPSISTMPKFDLNGFNLKLSYLKN